jgi:hypothetical protein
MHRMGLVLILITPRLTGLCSATDLRDHLVGVQHSTVHFSLPPRVQQVQGSGIYAAPASRSSPAPLAAFCF